MKTHCIYLLMMLIALGAHAQQKQKFSVAKFEEDRFDTSAQDKRYEKIDGNGSRYAIIKVTSTNPDDNLKEYSFNFGMLEHEVVVHDDELWVYVQKNAKAVDISRTGYVTLKRYDLGLTIGAGSNYVMVLSAEAVKTYKQIVQFNVTPGDVHSIIMYKSTSSDTPEEVLGSTDSNGRVAKALPLGNYFYRVVAENFNSTEGTFSLTDRKNIYVENITLSSNVANVTLNVDAEADIYVDEEFMGRSTWSGLLKIGSHQVECRQDSHRTTSEQIVVENGDDRTIQLKAPELITGTVFVLSSPLGATISINDQNYGETPKSIDLPIGKYDMTLLLPGYNIAFDSFEIKENETVDKNIAMESFANQLAQKQERSKKKDNDDDLTETVKPDANFEAVDLGLSVKWATFNVGAKKAEEAGDFFAWGCTDKFSKSTTKKLKLNDVIDDDSCLKLENDVARSKWGEDWRMPTHDEIKELIENSEVTWTSLNGVSGLIITGPNGNTIFLPCTGFKQDATISDKDTKAYYWSATLDKENRNNAYCIYFDENLFGDCSRKGTVGRCVRPVMDKKPSSE